MTNQTTTETVTATRRQPLNGHKWQVLVTIERTPATLTDEEKAERWYETTSTSIVSVSRVKVYTVTKRDADEGREDKYPTEALEVRYSSGAVAYVHNGEMTALVDANQKGYLNGCYFHKKYGLCRGWAIGWYMAQRSKRSLQNPERTRKSCALELYTRAQGLPYGSN
jgi:hypothetical protein